MENINWNNDENFADAWYKYGNNLTKKIKEFKLILEQELNSDNNSLGTRYRLHTLLEVYREHFQTELK